MPSRRLSPSRSLQKLRTVFSNHSPLRLHNHDSTSPTILSPTSSAASPSTSGSPTTSQQPFAGFAGFSFGGDTSPVFHSPAEFQFPPQSSASEDGYSRRVIRRKKSCVEIEIEQERVQFDGALVGLVEPRPRVGPALGGIEEVLGGKV